MCEHLDSGSIFTIELFSHGFIKPRLPKEQRSNPRGRALQSGDCGWIRMRRRESSTQTLCVFFYAADSQLEIHSDRLSGGCHLASK